MTQQEQAPEGRRPAAENSFRRGFLDGVPIGLGYFSVSIAFGILCAVNGMDIRATVLISMTNLTSAGQLAGAGVIFGGGTLLEMALTQLVINLRYALMSISLSQKLHKSVRFADRLWVSFFITDEIFAVSASKPGEVDRRYFMGVAIAPYLGWALGTLAGAVAGGLLPQSVQSAMAWRCMACLWPLWCLRPRHTAPCWVWRCWRPRLAALCGMCRFCTRTSLRAFPSFCAPCARRWCSHGWRL